MEKRSYWGIKSGAAQRYLLWHHLSKYVSHFYISEFPKSGGTWFCQMLSDILEVPFPRNRLVPLSKSILKSHHLIHADLYKPIVIIRDGRDVMVSAYFHFLLGTEFSPNEFVSLWRDKMPFDDYENVYQNMPEFMRIFSSEFRIGARKMNWAQHVENSLQVKDSLIIKYEDLLQNPADQLQKAAVHLNHEVTSDQIEAAIYRNSFQQSAQREQGTEKSGSFLRKGIAGDWKDKFNEEACQSFDNFAGDILIRLGYESDHKWY